MQCVFGSDRLLGTTKSTLTSGFSVYSPTKWHSHLHSNISGSWNLHLTNVNFHPFVISLMPAEGSVTTVKVREQNHHLDIFYRLIHTVTHINNPHFCSTGPFQRLRGYSVTMPVRTTPHHNRFTALFPGPPGWTSARREFLDFMMQGKINRGRHTDHPAGRHSILTNQWLPPPSPHIFNRPYALPAAQPTASKHWRQLVHSD